MFFTFYLLFSITSDTNVITLSRLPSPCSIFFKFRILYLMLQNDFLLWQMYFLSLGSVSQLLGAISQFLGELLQFLRELPQFSGELPQFSEELPQTQREGIENVPRGQRNSATYPKSLNLQPKTKCVITTIRQSKEMSLMCYSSTCMVAVCKLLIWLIWLTGFNATSQMGLSNAQQLKRWSVHR